MAARRITQREERPWIVRRKADLDAAGTRENLLRMIALKERLPELIIVPAHDMRAFGQMPTLSQASSEATRPNIETRRYGRKNAS
jgi:hypothetical protein